MKGRIPLVKLKNIHVAKARKLHLFKSVC